MKSLKELDVLRLERLLLRQQLLSVQLAYVEAEQRQLLAEIERRYRAKNYQLDWPNKRLVPPENNE